MSGGGPPEWQLLLDGTLCDGHGICVLRCPELLTLDGHGFAGADPAPFASRTVLRRARSAAAACPARALAVVPARHAGDERPASREVTRMKLREGRIEPVRPSSTRRPAPLR